MSDIMIIAPTVILKRDLEEDTESVMHVRDALVVFRSEEEVEKFREYSGLYTASEGFEAAPVDELGIGRICARHGLTSVAMPEPWTGTSGVDFFEAAEFITMLKESLEASPPVEPEPRDPWGGPRNGREPGGGLGRGPGRESA